MTLTQPVPDSRVTVARRPLSAQAASTAADGTPERDAWEDGTYAATWTAPPAIPAGTPCLAGGTVYPLDQLRSQGGWPPGAQFSHVEPGDGPYAAAARSLAGFLRAAAAGCDGDWAASEAGELVSSWLAMQGIDRAQLTAPACEQDTWWVD